MKNAGNLPTGRLPAFFFMQNCFGKLLICMGSASIRPLPHAELLSEVSDLHGGRLYSAFSPCRIVFGSFLFFVSFLFGFFHRICFGFFARFLSVLTFTGFLSAVSFTGFLGALFSGRPHLLSYACLDPRQKLLVFFRKPGRRRIDLRRVNLARIQRSFRRLCFFFLLLLF